MTVMVRAVCLDLMGVLLYDPYREALEAATGLDLPAAHRLKDPDCWPAFEIAAIDEAEFARRFFAGRGGARLDLDAFHRVRRGGYRFLPGMLELLEDLDGVVRRYVASNYPVWIEELRATFALDRRCEAVYASHHLGVRKPDPEFYRRLLDAIGLPPATCLFVDDRAVNCAAAEAAGMRAHLFDGVEGVRHRLRAEGVRLGG
jgi:HAD superfamily hydrolase (TIGR01509 family)